MIRISRENEPIPIRAGETHYRDFELEAGELLHVVAHQRGIDFAVRLRDPGGEVLIEVDSPNGSEGPEELVEVAERPGIHRFEVAAPEGVSAGRLDFRVLARRKATPADRELAAADHAYHEARALLRRAKPGEAIAKLRDALETWMRLELPRREADTRHALCRAHQSSNEGDLAIAFCEQAMELYRTLDDRLMVAVTLSRAASIRQRQGQVQRSLRYFEEALPLFREAGSQREVALTLAQLGTAHHRLGDFRQSLDHFERALPMIEQSAASESELAGVVLGKGEILLALNRSGDALDHYVRAEEIYRRLHDERRLAPALNRVANVALRLGELDKAEVNLAEAIRILRAQEKKGRTIERDLAISHVFLSRVEAKRRRFAEASAAARQALELSRRAEDRQIEATALLELGRLLTLDKRSAEGLDQLDRAFDLFTQIDDLTGQAIARVRTAGTLRELGRLDEAWLHVSPTLETVERLRTASDRFDVRTDYFAFRQEFFEVAIDILMDLHAREPEAGHHLRALEVHERRRARELLDVLAETPAASPQKVDPALSAEEGRLEDELRRLTGAPESHRELDDEVGRLVDELRRVRGQIRQARLRDLSAPGAAPARLDEIWGSLLDDDSLILDYALGENRSHLWSLSSRQLDAYELPPRRTIEGLALHFVEKLQTRSGRSPEARSRIARELSDILLAPVAAELANRRLILVPAGALQLIPFAALPSPHSAAASDFLVRNHEIVTLPSISVLVSLRRAEATRAAPKRAIAAFADPVLRLDDPRVPGGAGGTPAAPTGNAGPGVEKEVPTRDFDRQTYRLGLDPYRRLEHSREEVDAILSLVPDEDHLRAVGFAASRETFTTHRLGDFRILHFATHAFRDPDYPELSSLVLSLVDEKGKRRDGFIRAFEISRLRLPVELVVLSACQTGSGTTLPGEGVLGLTRAFFNAGAARVVSSLWRVSDRSTARLMTGFYEAYLGAGLAPAAALRQAQMTMLDDPQTVAPFNWAGFIFQGEWRRAAAGKDGGAAAPARQGGNDGRREEDR